MLEIERETYIEDAIAGDPRLHHVKSDVYGIAERLREYDENIFVVFNAEIQKYEIHSLDNKGKSLCAILPYDQLDARTMTFVRKHNVRVRGNKIFKEMDRHNEILHQQLARKRRNDLRGIAEEMRPYFKKFAWEEL